MATVWLAGVWDDLPQLRHALALEPTFAIVGGGAAAEPHPEAEPDVVLHIARGEDLPRDELASVREHTRAPIVLLTTQRSESLLREAIEMGIADVLLLPQSPESIAFALAKAVGTCRAGEASSPRAANVITVFSPKGGTGKSATATNVAAALAASGRRTLLVDFDLQFGDSAVMLGLEPERTLYDVVTAPGELDTDKLAGYTTRHESGLHLLAAPIRPEDGEFVTDAKAAAVLDAACDGYDMVVVDTAPFLQGAVLAALDRTSHLLLLCTPDVPALKNIRVAAQTLALLGLTDGRIRLVLNRANARIGFKAAEVGAVLDREVDVELPEDEAVAIGVNRGTPAVLYRPSAPFSQAVGRLAEELAAGTTPPRKSAKARRFAWTWAR